MDEGKAPGTLRVCRGEKTANYFIGVLGNLEQGLIPAEGSGDPALSAGIPAEAVSGGNPERGGPDPVQPGSLGCQDRSGQLQHLLQLYPVNRWEENQNHEQPK